MTTLQNDKALRLEFPFNVKAVDDDLGTFEAYVSTWSLDLQNDRIVPGAFKKTISELEARRGKRDGGFLLPVLYMHDPHNPIGGLFAMEEDEVGLFVKGLLDLTTEQGKRAFSGLKKGYCNSFSIGYRTRKDHMERSGVRILEAVDLIEVSVVSFPANPEARATGVKEFEDARALELIGKMRSILAEYEKQGGKRHMNENEYDRPRLGTPVNPLIKEPEPSYYIEYGLPEESRSEFEKSLRQQMREEMIYTS